MLHLLSPGRVVAVLVYTPAASGGGARPRQCAFGHSVQPASYLRQRCILAACDSPAFRPLRALLSVL